MTPIAIIQDSLEFVSPVWETLRTAADFRVTGIYYFPGDAIKGLQESPAEIVILDLHSRQHRGLEWMKEIKNKMPCTKWLVYTRYDDDETIFNALRGGANGYLLKDATEEQLYNALHELFRGGAPLSHRIIHKLLAYFYQQPQKENPPGMLSHREKQILHFTSRGLLYKEIALQLGIQRETVKKHLSKIYEKLQVQNKVEAVNKFYGL
jgi:two-component system, NarL family, response regulator LiaR